MRKLLQFLVLGVAFANIASSTAQADHWYVPGANQAPVHSAPIYARPVYADPVYAQPVSVAPASRLVRSTVIVAQPVYVQPVYAQPVTVYTEPVYMESVVVSHRAVALVPAFAGPAVLAPYKVREEIKSRHGHFEYEQKGKFRVYNQGFRPKTYRYEYEVDHRNGRTKYKFDIDD